MTTGESWSSVRRSLFERWRREFGILAALLYTACFGGRVPKTQYYTLDIPPPLAGPVSDPKTGFILGVERFRASETLRDDRIVYYESPTKLNFYEYHRWSAEPATLLAQLVARRLKEMEIFADVRHSPGREQVDYLLRGRIFNFDEVDYEGTKGRVALELTLIRSRDNKAAWSRTLQVEHPAEGSEVAGVVKAVNAASEELLREALPGLVAQVERDFTEVQAEEKQIKEKSSPGNQSQPKQTQPN